MSKNAHNKQHQAQAIILGAGEGTRMRSSRPKVLHEVAQFPMIGHVIRAAEAAGLHRPCLVLGYGKDQVVDGLQHHGLVFDTATQTERLGTGHAVMTVLEAGLLADGAVMVLLGDAPLVRSQQITAALDAIDTGADIVVVGFETDDPTGYGRLVTDGSSLLAIVEEKDADEAQRQIQLCNSGLMAFGPGHLARILPQITSHNAKGEYYLTDAIALANEIGLSVTYVTADEADLLGVNTRVDLARVEAHYQDRRRTDLMLAGVTMQAPDTVMVAFDTHIEPDVILQPNIVFGAGVTVRSGATIQAFSHLEGAVVQAKASIGPFARLRPGTDVGEGAKVGNFCETKKATVGAGAKVNHLSYIGDAHIGEEANIGAGTITCNYDGTTKHKTVVGSGAFIGSNSALVAPVSIGQGAYVGSGSVITKDVSPGDLAIGRGRQVNLKGRAPKTGR